MAKKGASRQGLSKLSFYSTLFGSLIFLSLSLAIGNNVFVLGGSTGIWQPLLYSGAVVGSLVLLMICFGNYGRLGHTFASSSLKMTIITTFALMALTIGINSEAFVIALAGFVFAFLGSSAAYVV